MRRKAEIYTHIAAVILHREYSRLMQLIYAAVLTMDCEGDYHIGVLDKDVKVIKQVRTLSNDLLKPKHHVTCVLVSGEPRTVKVRYACSNEVSEQEVMLSKAMRFVIYLLLR